MRLLHRLARQIGVSPAVAIIDPQLSGVV